ncbi:MAG: hypothetical protein Q7S98_02440 [Deltaproteobacteria bacterium]|nr:hypothetical protein [Deltaproteobacteria bacterium]
MDPKIQQCLPSPAWCAPEESEPTAIEIESSPTNQSPAPPLATIPGFYETTQVTAATARELTGYYAIQQIPDFFTDPVNLGMMALGLGGGIAIAVFFPIALPYYAAALGSVGIAGAAYDSIQSQVKVNDALEHFSTATNLRQREEAFIELHEGAMVGGRIIRNAAIGAAFYGAGRAFPTVRVVNQVSPGEETFTAPVRPLGNDVVGPSPLVWGVPRPAASVPSSPTPAGTVPPTTGFLAAGETTTQTSGGLSVVTQQSPVWIEMPPQPTPLPVLQAEPVFLTTTETAINLPGINPGLVAIFPSAERTRKVLFPTLNRAPHLAPAENITIISDPRIGPEIIRATGAKEALLRAVQRRMAETMRDNPNLYIEGDEGLCYENTLHLLQWATPAADLPHLNVLIFVHRETGAGDQFNDRQRRLHGKATIRPLEPPKAWRYHLMVEAGGRIYDYDYSGRPGTPINQYAREMFPDQEVDVIEIPAPEFLKSDQKVIEGLFGQGQNRLPLEESVGRKQSRFGETLPYDDIPARSEQYQPRTITRGTTYGTTVRHRYYRVDRFDWQHFEADLDSTTRHVDWNNVDGVRLFIRSPDPKTIDNSLLQRIVDRTLTPYGFRGTATFEITDSTGALHQRTISPTK